MLGKLGSGIENYMAKRVFIVFIIWLSFAFPGPVCGRLYYYSGTMEGHFEMTHYIYIVVPGGIASLTFMFPLPGSYSLPSNDQDISGLNITWSDIPSEENYTDAYGNNYIKFTWEKPIRSIITVIITYAVSSRADWNKFVTSDPFPFNSSGLPDSVMDFLQPSDKVQSDYSVMLDLADTLTSGITTQWEAAMALNGWIMDNISYGDNPYGYDAYSTFILKRGTCSNYAHMALALLRAAGIPARLAHGYSLTKPYFLPIESGSIEANWGQGTHAWVEVYYPSLGWVPYDPQRDVHHVDTHRVLSGRGSDSTGLMGGTFWSFSSPPSDYPATYEALSINWITDNINLSFLKSTNEIAAKSFSTGVTYIKKYVVTASTGIGGNISPSGRVYLTDLDSQDFTITPDSGYYTAEILVDGLSKNAVSTYTFNNISEDHTISARFQLIDSDNDGLPDWWEQQIMDYDQNDGINRFEDILPEEDFDGDNFSNKKEYQADTDPTDSGSHPPRPMPWLFLLEED